MEDEKWLKEKKDIRKIYMLDEYKNSKSTSRIEELLNLPIWDKNADMELTKRRYGTRDDVLYEPDTGKLIDSIIFIQRLEDLEIVFGLWKNKTIEGGSPWK